MSLDAKQLALRRTGVTGTDVAAILGLSPWRSALDVWLDKAGKAPPVEVSEDMERGTFLEDGARRWYAHRTGARVEEPGTVMCPDNPLVIATPDGLAFLPSGEERALEIKMPSSALGWGEAGTDAVPDYYVPQVVWELAATRKPMADVFAVLEGKPRLYHVARDTELEGLLVDEMARWWRNHVVADRAPEVTARDAGTVSRWMRRHEGDKPLAFDALPPTTQVVLEEYLRAYAEESAAAERLALWETRAKLALGTAPGVAGLPEESGWARIDWRQSKGRPLVDLKAFRAALADEDPEVRRRVETLLEQHSKTSEGARPFVPRPITKGKR
jgi:putative phage-type endonuclease